MGKGQWMESHSFTMNSILPKKCSCDQHKIMINIRGVDFKTDTLLSVDKIQNANLFSLLAQRLTMLICWYFFFSINLNMIFFVYLFITFRNYAVAKAGFIWEMFHCMQRQSKLNARLYSPLFAILIPFTIQKFILNNAATQIFSDSSNQ